MKHQVSQKAHSGKCFYAVATYTSLYSLQCRRFHRARANGFNRESAMLKLPKRGGNGASQGEGGGGGEKEEKTPARKHCENDKHPLISRAWPLFRK